MSGAILDGSYDVRQKLETLPLPQNPREDEEQTRRLINKYHAGKWTGYIPILDEFWLDAWRGVEGATMEQALRNPWGYVIRWGMKKFLLEEAYEWNILDMLEEMRIEKAGGAGL